MKRLLFPAVLLAAGNAAAQQPAQPPAPAAALAAPTGNPATRFGPRESVGFLDISPSGRYAVYIAPANGTASAAVIADLVQGGDARPILRSTGQPERLSWCRFVSDIRLVCSIHAVGNVEGLLVGYDRLFALNADGSNIREMGQRSSAYDYGLRQSSGAVLDWLPGDGNAVLMARNYLAEAQASGSRMARREEGLGVDRIDINTLRVTEVEPADRRAGGYLSDRRGNVRVMIAPQSREGELSPWTNFYYRLAGQREWRDLGRYNSQTREGLYPLAIDAECNCLFALKTLNGRLALYRVKLDESLANELVYANERVDVDNVVRVGRGGRVAGVTFAEDRRQVIWFDPRYSELSRSLVRSLPGRPAINFRGESSDGNKLLVLAEGDANPGRYYLYDRTTRALEELMAVRPQLDGVPLSQVRPVTYPAADGIQVPAYLTLPPGRQDARGLPGIVLPHGGPSARDEWGFDWLAQYFANQGYAVLQPNYRGSEGYGDAWMAQNGFRGWQTSIGDVTAGGRWLVAQGADANRMAIVGWSYGGYAALQSGVTEPGLFKAIVAIAPVTDLALLIEQADRFTNSRLVRQFVGTGPHVRAGSPLQNVDRIAAPVLLFHGTRDINVGISHAQRMDAALRAAGKRTELITFQNLEHDLADSAARVQMLQRIGTFLQTSLARP